MSELYLQSNRLLEAGFALHGFTVSGNYGFGGPDDDATVVTNLASLKAALKTDLPLLRLKQVHGAEVVAASTALEAAGNNDWSTPPALEGDALVSGSTAAILGVLTADCLPILIASTDTGHVAAIHAGWRGLSKSIVQRAARQLLAAGGSPDAIVCAIGPAICINCYDVGDDVARFFPESVDPIGKNTESWQLDLPNAAEVSLIASGFSTTQIEKLSVCTKCSPMNLHSYRRDKDTCGRQLSFIAPR